MADWLEREGHDAVVIPALDSVAWLLNIRGADVPHTPVALSYVIAHKDGSAELFIAPEKVTPELTRHLGNAVTIRERAAFEAALGELSGKSVALDPDFAVVGIAQGLRAGGAKFTFKQDPTILAKAIKNGREQQGPPRRAGARRGGGEQKFLRWLEVEAPGGGIDELAAAAPAPGLPARKIRACATSASTPSLPLPATPRCPHYKVDEDSNIPIPPSSIYLVDSGGQYPGGTTDITRTVWVGPGEPSAEMRGPLHPRVEGPHPDRPRGVSPKAPAAASSTCWRGNIYGKQGSITPMAPVTGSAVSSACTKARSASPSRAAGQAGTAQELFAGMILSNEPGYYKAGAFGIRIENLRAGRGARNYRDGRPLSRIRDADLSCRWIAS